MKKSASRSTTFGISTTFICRVLVLFANFLVAVLLARWLGPDGHGVVTAIFVIPTLIMTLADAGIRQSTAYFIGQNKYATETVVSNLTIIVLFTSLISIIVASGTFYFQFGSKYGYLILVIALLTIPINLMAQYSKGVMQGKDRISNINISELIKIAAHLVGIIVFVWLLNMGIVGAILAQLLMASTFMAYSLYVVSQESKITYNFNVNVTLNLLKKGVAFAIALFLLQLNYRIDILFLETLTSSKEVGLYAVGTKIAELIWQIPSAISLVLFSKSAISKTNSDAVLRTVRLVRVVLPILFILSLLLWFMAKILVGTLFGQEFIESGIVVRYLLIGIFTMVVVKLLHADLAARGYPLFIFWIALLALIINIISNLLLIPKYGMYGAAIGSTISYSIAGLTITIAYARKEKIWISEMLILKNSDLKILESKFMKLMNFFKLNKSN